MNQILSEYETLPERVDTLLQLLHRESSLRTQDVSAVQASLKKAIAPKFEIVFAGAFSAGKSMLINALLERELLYSAEGHATGTQCYIEYAKPDSERVVLTFSSGTEIREQAMLPCQRLGMSAADDIDRDDFVTLLEEGCDAIIQQERGESRSERAKQAKALMLLLEGYAANRDRIHPINKSIVARWQHLDRFTRN